MLIDVSIQPFAYVYHVNVKPLALTGVRFMFEGLKLHIRKCSIAGTLT